MENNSFNLDDFVDAATGAPASEVVKDPGHYHLTPKSEYSDTRDAEHPKLVGISWGDEIDWSTPGKIMELPRVSFDPSVITKDEIHEIAVHNGISDDRLTRIISDLVGYLNRPRPDSVIGVDVEDPDLITRVPTTEELKGE